MLGSYSADPNPRTSEVISDEFPSGMIARGTYKVRSKVIDLDESVWLGARLSWQSPNSCQDRTTDYRRRLGMATQDCEGLVRTASYDWLECSWICGCCESNAYRSSHFISFQS